ncbi:MAG: FAD-dependent oxidoreductase [Phycisphaeraceae bacterium]|nr:FAD-dependent oxidoreductase [Phycisphaeraceae bacterium]
MDFIPEKSKRIPIRGKWDVIIAGGGLGGVAAGIAAARTGARTVLVERNTFVGGVATAAMVCSIFNCFYTSKHQLGSLGIPVEIADSLATATGYGRKWHDHKGHIIFDLEKGKLVLQQLLEDAGVELLFGVTVTDAIVEENTIKGLVIESKSGRESLLARTVVDSTGDADIAFLSGAPVNTPQSQGSHQLQSLCFRLGNVDIDAFVNYFREHPDEYPDQMDVDWVLEDAIKQYDECGTFLFPHGGGIQMKAFQQASKDQVLPKNIGIHHTTNACQMHGLRQTRMVHVITGFVKIDGLEAGTVSKAINDGRRMAFILAEVYRRYIPGFEHAIVAGVADNLGVRSSRWIKSDFAMTKEMMRPGTRQKDAVGALVPYHASVKNPSSNAWIVQVMGEDTFDLPYGCLLPRHIDGLLMGAGRSIGVTEPFMLRVMVHTMSVGQAAGAAAAVSALNKTTPRETAIEDIQSALARLTKEYQARQTQKVLVGTP